MTGKDTQQQWLQLHADGRRIRNTAEKATLGGHDLFADDLLAVCVPARLKSSRGQWVKQTGQAYGMETEKLLL